MRFSTWGQTVYGLLAFTETQNFPAVVQNNTSPGLMRTQYGWGLRSQRGWTRPEVYEPLPTSEGDVGEITITISSVSGAVLGRIRTDIEKPIFHSLDFTNDENGCADFTLRLARLPDFEILPFSLVEVNVANAPENQYCGVITFLDEAGTRGGVFEAGRNRPFEYRGYGLRRYLDGLRADVDFAALLDVGEVARQIFRNYVVGVDEPAPFSPIRYNESKIDTNTAAVLANDIELGKFTLRQTLETLAKMAPARYGVDGAGETYFEQDSGAIKKVFIIGARVNDFDPKVSYETIKNAIVVQRQASRGSGQAGWAVAGIYNDTASVKKYGRNELLYQIPGYFSDNDADTIGNALRDELSEPSTSADIAGLQILTEGDFLRRGTYRFIMPLAEYRQTVNDVDDASAFTIVNAGDLVKANDTTFGNYVYANGGVKFTFQNAATQRAELTIEARGIIKQIRFYIKSTRAGAFLTLGVGAYNWAEHTTKVDVQVIDEFIPFVWDVSELGLEFLQKFALRIDANQVGPTNLWIDKLDVIYRGHETYDLTLKRATYSFGPRGSTIKAEFGTLPASLSDYVSGLLATASELKFTGEVR